MAESEDVFGLNGQIEHKLGFLLEHVPQDTRLVLIGHSIGCYIILEMMKRDPELKVKPWLEKYVIFLLNVYRQVLKALGLFLLFCYVL